MLATEGLCIAAGDAGDAGARITEGTGEMASVVIADIMAEDGVIYVVDKVLLPGARPACH